MNLAPRRPGLPHPGPPRQHPIPCRPRLGRFHPHPRFPLLAILLGLAFLPARAAAPLRIADWNLAGRLGWTNAPAPGVVTLETASSPAGPWNPLRRAYATQGAGSLVHPPTSPHAFHRLSSVEVPGTPTGFTNLVQSYGLLETIAGNGGGQTDGVSYWQEWYENQPGPWVSLSRPHFAMADRAGRVFIADKNSHSILRLDTDGTLSTHAGTHFGGFNGEGPAPATELQLDLPNGLWVRADGTVYVLDAGNGRVRRVDTNRVARTLFLATSNGSSLAGGRGLWVSDDESLAYVGNETRIRAWSPGAGLRTLASGFSDLGLFIVEPDGTLLACDRGAHHVYRVTASGTRTVVAGNGRTTGGGDGSPALATGLHGVRGIWPIPTGGHLLLTHDGCQLWHWDTAGILRLLVHGAGGRTHAGDGLPFFAPDEPRISEGRSVTLDHDGHILVCESDWGYVRRIRFAPYHDP